MLLQKVACWLAISSLSLAGALPRDASGLRPAPVVARQATPTRIPDGECTNDARNRQCWGGGFSISTDFDDKAPPAGEIVPVCPFEIVLEPQAKCHSTT